MIITKITDTDHFDYIKIFFLVNDSCHWVIASLAPSRVVTGVLIGVLCQ